MAGARKGGKASNATKNTHTHEPQIALGDKVLLGVQKQASFANGVCMRVLTNDEYLYLCE